MFFFDKPYISDFLLETIEDNHIPVLRSPYAEEVARDRNINFLDQKEAIALARSNHELRNDLRIMTSSENSISWISEHFDFLETPKTINAFKDKLKFREKTATLHPEFIFSSVPHADLDTLDAETLNYPFIIKPAFGFFSMGVHLVTNSNEWQKVKQALQVEFEKGEDIYPLDVMNSSLYIIEDLIEGDEFAIDAYFDDQGDVVILNIFQHLFSSISDVGDRVYISSKEIIEENLEPFKNYIAEIGKIFDVKNFPIHIEVRQSATREICAIEVNPLRFGGWCTTADMTWFSYGINAYLYYLKQQKLDWAEILKEKAGLTYAIVVLDNSTGAPGEKIKAFNFEKVQSKFEKVLDVRKIDHLAYPLFGFMFLELKEEELPELENILVSSLEEFIVT